MDTVQQLPAPLPETRLRRAKRRRSTFWRKFTRNKLAIFGMICLLVFYLTAAFAEFVAPYEQGVRDRTRVLAPPQTVRFFDNQGRFRGPFVYELAFENDPMTGIRSYVEDTSSILPIRPFVRGEPYRLLGLIPSTTHLFGVRDGIWYPFGGDEQGRDVFSRIILASRISLTIGMLGAILTVIFGTLLGTVSGYFGGSVDTGIQRLIELLSAFPTIPLWMTLAAAMPVGWSPVTEFFLISVILSLLSWGGLARQIRGIVLALRETDYIMAASALGATQPRILVKHMIPNIMGYVVINLSLAIPLVILGETSLSFLGLGLRPPVNSWGVLLVEAQNVRAIVNSPWLLLPGLFVVLAVLAFNFIGDGLRDALDPHKR